jgi:hypothetical protein
MPEAVIDGANGRVLTIRRASDRAEEYEAILQTPDGSARALAYDDGTWLAAYVRDLADSWTGFEGAKSYGSLEGDLDLEATHDGIGTVELRVNVRDPSPPEWSFMAVLLLGAGAHLERVAADLERAFGR